MPRAMSAVDGRLCHSVLPSCVVVLSELAAMLVEVASVPTAAPSSNKYHQNEQ